jgi:para-nitrobenzyl esterase
MDLWAADQLKASQRVYTYYFDRVMPWPAHPEFGAFHTSEVPYVFQTLDRVDRPWEPVDRQIAETVSAYRTNFAKTGDPNGDGLAPWPSYSPDAHTTMQLGPHMGAMRTTEPDKLAFFSKFLKK